MFPAKWLMYYPQFHAFISVVALVCLGFIIAIWRRGRNDDTKCPCCHRNTLDTVQKCKHCKFIRWNSPRQNGFR